MTSDTKLKRKIFFARAAIRRRKESDREYYEGKYKKLPDGTFIKTQY